MNPVDQWRPSASLEMLRRRAGLFRRCREFFHRRGVLEVDTPLLVNFPVTDVHVDNLEVCATSRYPRGRRFLHTSPEYAMKRLLAAGSGPIFQICKVFRDDPEGPLHNREFTLLEWYRPGFDQWALMTEVEALLGELGWTQGVERRSYAQVFYDQWGVESATATVRQLAGLAAQSQLNVTAAASLDRHQWLDLLFGAVLIPKLGWERPVFVTEFPPEQAALAEIDPGPPPVARRFELIINGIEIGNGYQELRDPEEHRVRFEADRRCRRQEGLPDREMDPFLLAAVHAGLPACSGVAIGLDRLLLSMTGKTRLEEVLPFVEARA